MMKLKTQVTLPAAGLSGFETPLSEEEAAVQAGLHRFAKEVMRPLGIELDRMSADAVIAPGSPYNSLFAEYAKLGLLCRVGPADPAKTEDILNIDRLALGIIRMSCSFDSSTRRRRKGHP